MNLEIVEANNNTNANDTSLRSDRLGLPWDFRDWLRAEELSAWIQEEIATLDWNDAALEAFLKSHPDFRPKSLLGVLIYGYMTGIYESEEIVNGCYADATLRELSDGIAPTVKELKAFRRENRGLIRGFLIQLFRRGIKARVGELPAGAGMKRTLVELATERIDIARHMDTGSIGD